MRHYNKQRFVFEIFCSERFGSDSPYSYCILATSKTDAIKKFKSTWYGHLKIDSIRKTDKTMEYIQRHITNYWNGASEEMKERAKNDYSDYLIVNPEKD